MGSSQAQLQLTARDRELLSFLADHRLVLASHVCALLGISAERARARLRALARAEYVKRRPVFHGQPSAYLVTRRGLGALDSALPPPRLDLRPYLHDVGAAWLWLAARRGRFGPVAEVLSERQLRSRDGLPHESDPLAPAERQGVRLWEFGPAGRERLHYPDLVLRTPDGRRIALELELSSKGARRLEGIVSALGSDRRIDAVVYLVERPEVARAVRTAAVRAGVSDRVHVQRFTWTPSMQRLARQLSPTGGRVRGRATEAARAVAEA